MLPNWCANPEEVITNQSVWRQILADAERRSPRKECKLVFVSPYAKAKSLPKTRTRQYVYLGRDPEAR